MKSHHIVAVGRAVARLPPHKSRRPTGIATLMRNYRTGLFRDTRFRMITYSATNCLFPAVRFAQIHQTSMSGLCFLYELRIPVNSFPTPAPNRRRCV